MVSKAAQAATEAGNNNITQQQALAWEKASNRLEKIAKVAAKVIADMDSDIFSIDSLDVIPKFGVDELTLGRLLGKGGFGSVNEIRSMQCKEESGASESRPTGGNFGFGDDDDDDEWLIDQELQDKKFIADHCLREGGDSRYCVKALSPDVIADEVLFNQGVIDMSFETMFLSTIFHPHIITMRAFGVDGMFNPNYFILLDRLYDTLEARIPKWKMQSRKAKSLKNKIRKKSGGKLVVLMEKKLTYALDLCGAFEYLHDMGIVYRDLKPENVGFNIRDDIVLFDFGLARETNKAEKVSNTTWKLTGETGSLRYMAPEVADNRPYGHSADIYSFGIMLWQMLTMEIPYEKLNKKMHANLVVAKGARPKIPDSLKPSSIKDFLNSCWSQHLNRRPTAKEVSKFLQGEVEKGEDGDEIMLKKNLRKSTFVNARALREVAKKVREEEGL